MENSKLFDQMIKAITDGKKQKVVDLAERALQKDISPMEVLKEGCIKGITEVGRRYDEGTFFLPELVMGAEAMIAAVEVVKPAMEKSGHKMRMKGRGLSGTVEGDIHDIGKTIVNSFLSANGFDIIDLGTDVAVETFINKVRIIKPDLLLMSALLTTTMPRQQEVIESLKESGLCADVKVMVGGAPVTKEWATEIGADGYAEDAVQALMVAEELVSV